MDNKQMTCKDSGDKYGGANFFADEEDVQLTAHEIETLVSFITFHLL